MRPAAAVSVVLATYNRAGYLAECLDSLLAQTQPASEIVVVDDGSDDDTAAVVARYKHRVRYLYQANAGKSSAINLALAHCHGDWVWVFDDDDVALPNAIETRLAAAQAAPDATVVYASHMVGHSGPDGRAVAERLYTPPRPAGEAFFLAIMTDCFFHLNGCLVQRSLWDRIGGLDTELLRGQDYDAQIRLARLASFAFCDRPAFIFRQHAGERGPKCLRADGETRADAFRRFSAQVGLKIRRDVPLHEFTVPRCTPPMDVPNQRAALVNRLLVMANHGCVQPMLDDVRALLEVQPAQPLTRPETARLAQAIGRGWAYEASAQDWPAFVQGLRRVQPLPGGAAAVRAFARGLLTLAKSYPGKLADRGLKFQRATHLALQSLV